MTGAILLPSGIGHRKGDHFLRATDEGRTVEISVQWPPSMTDIDYLHRNEIKANPDFVH